MNKVFKYLTFLALGTLFGIALTKGEVISWYRIQEMFRFQAFHMYGVIGTAVLLGIATNQVMFRLKAKDFEGQPYRFNSANMSVWRYLLGGTLFGLGWAMTGACPGPLYILVGSGISVMLVAIGSAIVGTYVYGLLRDRLPH